MSLLKDTYKDKKVLITGHTGFKGAWMSEWMLMLGARIVGYALEPPSTPSLFEQLNLTSRLERDYREDIRDGDKLFEVIEEERPNFIFHMAAQSLVGVGYREPVKTFDTNVMGTVNLLEAIRHVDEGCISVLITTDKVYENKEWEYSYREEDRLGGYDPYSASKACGELAISAYKRSYLDASLSGAKSKPCVSVRAGNVIGGGDWAEDRIVPDSMRSLAANRPIPVRNKVATRPWQHVLEPVGGYMLLAAQIDQARRRGDRRRMVELCQPFNFGPAVDSNKPVETLVEEILGHWPGSWQDESDPDSPHEAGKLNLSSDRAFHLLGWLPRWGFEPTIEKTVTWYKMASGFGAADDFVELTRSQIYDYMDAG